MGGSREPEAGISSLVSDNSALATPLETKQVARFHKELAAIVQISGAAGEYRLVGIAEFR